MWKCGGHAHKLTCHGKRLRAIGTMDRALNQGQKVRCGPVLSFIGSTVLHKPPNFFEMIFLPVKWERHGNDHFTAD